MPLRAEPPIPHNRLTFGEEEVRAVESVVRSGQWACGPQVELFENKLSAQTGGLHAVCVGSGLGALRLALGGLGVGKGDAVIVPAFSCVALANAVLALGATPVPADIQPGNWTIDPASVRSLLSRRTKAILAVHTFGMPAPVRELKEFGVPVIEDCAHAFGILSDNVPLGTLGDAAILSFYATKLLGAGEGGAVLTRDVEIADFVRGARDYADQPADPVRLNDKMTDVAAALAQAQLVRLPAMLAARQHLANRYHELLSPEASNGRFILPQRSNSRVWYRYAVEVPGSAPGAVIDALWSRGITAVRPVENWGAEPRKHPAAVRGYEHLVSLPLYPTLTDAEQNRIAEAFLSFFHE